MENRQDTEQQRSSELSEQQSDAAVRRRLLLKGLGKGSALLAAASPLAAVAADASAPSSPPVLNRYLTPGGKLCTVSGNQSGVRSGPQALDVCGGYPPLHYVNQASDPSPRNWPQVDPATGKSWRYSVLFPNSPSPIKHSLIVRILNANPASDEAFWIAAYFNALQPSLHFPYSTADVVAQETSDPGRKFVTFYGTVLSNLPA